MTIDYKISGFPTFPVDKQLFHVPGAAFDGGFTSGGSRIMSPEPGGRSMLEMQPAWSVTEWDYPLASWVMSKINGDIFRIRLAPTPQVLRNQSNGPVDWDSDILWSNAQPWGGDLISTYIQVSLEGTNVVYVDMSVIGPFLQPGHVIGAGDYTYLVDEIEYDNSGIATVTLKPPLRTDIAIDDTVYFRPFFLGSITNGSEIRATYDSENVGMIQLNKIVFGEVII